MTCNIGCTISGLVTSLESPPYPSSQNKDCPRAEESKPYPVRKPCGNDQGHRNAKNKRPDAAKSRNRDESSHICRE
jgi:hypothetical protein